MPTKTALVMGLTAIGAAVALRQFYPSDRKYREDEWTKVRVWRARNANGTAITSTHAVKTSFFGGRANVGHVSVELSNGRYTSFWPDWYFSSPGADGRKTPVQGRHNTLAQDEKAEGRKADVLETFYTLDIEEMEKMLADPPQQWVLKNTKSGSAENCSSFAHELLIAGGIYQLVDVKTAPKVKIAMAPDDIAELVIRARQAELAQYPDTANYGHSPEVSQGCCP